MSVWRMSVIIEMDAENIDQAESIGRAVWERCAPVCQEIEGVKWMLPVGDFKERDVFAADSNPASESRENPNAPKLIAVAGCECEGCQAIRATYPASRSSDD